LSKRSFTSKTRPTNLQNAKISASQNIEKGEEKKTVIGGQEKILVVMFEKEEADTIKDLTANLYSNDLLKFTHKDSVLLNPKDFDIIVVDVFGIADDDIEENVDYYSFYIKEHNNVIWLVQEDEDDLVEWCKKLNKDV